MSTWRKGRYGWTKNAWLAYKDWAERWERWAMNQTRVFAIIAEMESRED
jgi:hypothetical protein